MVIAQVDRDIDARTAFAAAFADEQSFDDWYATALPRVYGYVFARCGHDQDLAEDLTQQTFIEVVRNHDRFDGRSDPLTWVCGIARHKLADYFRRLDVEERSRLRLIDRMERGNETTPASEIEQRQVIVAALASLPALQRAVLVFSALDGLTAREIGDLVDRSEGAVESLLHRARGSFKRAYGISEGQDDE